MLTFSLRSLWRNRLFTVLNILGLAIGVSACWVTYLIVRHEFGYESGISDSDRIYHVVSRFVIDGKESGNAGAPRPMANALRSEIAGVEISVPVREQWVPKLAIPQGEGIPPTVFEQTKQIIGTTNQYFQLVPYRWLAGNPAHFDAPGKVVLTQERAARYFPNFTPDQVLGRQIIYNDTVRVSVIGVVAPLDFPSDFNGLEFLTPGTLQKEAADDDNAWGGVSSNNQVFIKVAPGTDIATMSATVNRLSAERSAKAMKRWGGNFTRSHELNPLKEVHFATEYADNHRKADKETLFVLLGIAGFLLLLACINFINLATAQLPGRSREIGIRKTLGSGRQALVIQFLSETFFTGFLAAGLAYGLVHLFVTEFKEFIPEGMQVNAHFAQTALFLLGLLTVVSLLAGLYPGWLATKVQPSKILRGEPVIAIGKQRFTLRKGLIVFQFSIAQLFMLSALVVGSQLRYGLNNDLGFQRDAVLTTAVPLKVQLDDSDNDRRFVLLDEWKRLPGVAAVSLGEPPVSFSSSSNTMRHQGKNGMVEANVYRKFADTAYIGLYQMPLLAGRNLLPSDTIREYVINETCARAFGFTQAAEAVDEFLHEVDESAQPVQIVGVVRDFHTASFAEKIQPVAIMTDKRSLSDFNIQLAGKRPADWAPTIAEMGRVWDKFYPGEKFETSFYDATLEKIYESELQMARLINLVTAIAILISCLGLFGLATLTAFQRTKEIGVRKVLGASVVSVVALLSRDFVKLVFIGLLIAGPIAWILMQKFLQMFAYRIEMGWWMYASVGLAATVIAAFTVSFQSIRAALANPVQSLRSE